ncbi:MAG TPA: DUF2163 domain-containing protein [Thauera aminoaromatica]|nr:DUF2163 domain-containing protein [Thauera aminoaromatica]
MKTITGGMATHLAEEVTTLALLWRIVRQDGIAFFFTTHDEDIQYPTGSPSDLYKAAGGFSQSAISNQAGMNVDDVEVTAFFDDESISVEELRAGLFDGAEVFMSAVNYKDLSLGEVKLRRGWIGECIATPEGRFKTELRGLTELLQEQHGQVYSPECRADLGDTRCGVDLAAYTSSVTITSVIDRRQFTVSGAASDDPTYYAGGLFTFTSGPNAGRAMEIAQWGLGSPEGSPATPLVTLFLPVGYTPQVGDTGTMTPGCDKTTVTCQARFANLLNFRGEPYLPGVDAMLLYPDAK